MTGSGATPWPPPERGAGGIEVAIASSTHAPFLEMGPPCTRTGTRMDQEDRREAISSPQPDPQRPNLVAPKVKEQHQHDTDGHTGEIESATGVEMMHISQSLVSLLLHALY
jgi:hypothetical protein